MIIRSICLASSLTFFRNPRNPLRKNMEWSGVQRPMVQSYKSARSKGRRVSNNNGLVGQVSVNSLTCAKHLFWLVLGQVQFPICLAIIMEYINWFLSRNGDSWFLNLRNWPNTSCDEMICSRRIMGNEGVRYSACSRHRQITPPSHNNRPGNANCPETVANCRETSLSLSLSLLGRGATSHDGIGCDF